MMAAPTPGAQRRQPRPEGLRRDVLGVNRQQRRHAPQKNGEEIERDQAEQQAVRPNVANSAEYARIGERTFRIAGRVVPPQAAHL